MFSYIVSMARAVWDLTFRLSSQHPPSCSKAAPNCLLLTAQVHSHQPPNLGLAFFATQSKYFLGKNNMEETNLQGKPVCAKKQEPDVDSHTIKDTIPKGNHTENLLPGKPSRLEEIFP